MAKLLKDVLNETLDQLDLRRQVEVGAVFCDWDRVVGDRVAENARPSRLVAGTLFVETSSAVWAQELTLLKTKIMRELNAVQKWPIEDIRFRCGERARAAPSAVPVSEAAPQPTRLSASDRAAIEASVGGVKDNELKARLRRIMSLDRKARQTTRRIANQGSGNDA